MLAKAGTSGNPVVVQDAEHPKVDALRIVVGGEGKCMIAIEPAVVGVTAGIRCVKDHIRTDLIVLLSQQPKTAECSKVRVFKHKHRRKGRCCKGRF